MAASWAQLSNMNLLCYTAWQCSVSHVQWVTMRRATWVQFLHSAESFYHSLPFCVALSPSVDWHERFLYCCALYDFVFLEFCLWRSRADRVLTFNMNIQLPLFWRTWRRATAQDSCHMCWPGTWAVIIAVVFTLQTNVPEKAWPLYFFALLKILPNSPTLRVFQPWSPRQEPAPSVKLHVSIGKYWV